MQQGLNAIGSGARRANLACNPHPACLPRLLLTTPFFFCLQGVIYGRYRPEKLMEHLKLFTARINIPRLIRSCDEQQHWKELTFLYTAYDEFDNAAACMMAHGSSAWEHVGFKDVAVKVSNTDVHYRALSFYLEEHPDLLVDLLNVLQSRLVREREQQGACGRKAPRGAVWKCCGGTCVRESLSMTSY